MGGGSRTEVELAPAGPALAEADILQLKLVPRKKKKKKTGGGVRWTEDTVDNEHMGKKKSKSGSLDASALRPLRLTPLSLVQPRGPHEPPPPPNPPTAIPPRIPPLHLP